MACGYSEVKASILIWKTAVDLEVVSVEVCYFTEQWLGFVILHIHKCFTYLLRIRNCCGRYGFNSEGFKVVHDRLKLRTETRYGESYHYSSLYVICMIFKLPQIYLKHMLTLDDLMAWLCPCPPVDTI